MFAFAFVIAHLIHRFFYSFSTTSSHLVNYIRLLSSKYSRNEFLWSLLQKRQNLNNPGLIWFARYVRLQAFQSYGTQTEALYCSHNKRNKSHLNGSRVWQFQLSSPLRNFSLPATTRGSYHSSGSSEVRPPGTSCWQHVLGVRRDEIFHSQTNKRPPFITNLSLLGNSRNKKEKIFHSLVIFFSSKGHKIQMRCLERIHSYRANHKRIFFLLLQLLLYSMFINSFNTYISKRKNLHFPAIIIQCVRGFVQHVG